MAQLSHHSATSGNGDTYWTKSCRSTEWFAGHQALPRRLYHYCLGQSRRGRLQRFYKSAPRAVAIMVKIL